MGTLTNWILLAGAAGSVLSACFPLRLFAPPFEAAFFFAVAAVGMGLGMAGIRRVCGNRLASAAKWLFLAKGSGALAMYVLEGFRLNAGWFVLFLPLMVLADFVAGLALFQTRSVAGYFSRLVGLLLMVEGGVQAAGHMALRLPYPGFWFPRSFGLQSIVHGLLAILFMVLLSYPGFKPRN